MLLLYSVPARNLLVVASVDDRDAWLTAPWICRVRVLHEDTGLVSTRAFRADALRRPTEFYGHALAGGVRAVQALIKDLAHENLIIVTHAARTIELLGEKALNAKAPMAAALKRAETIRPPNTPATVVLPGDKDLAMFVAFSCRTFLSKFDTSD